MTMLEKLQLTSLTVSSKLTDLKMGDTGFEPVTSTV
jgi:hypothetical protein